MPSRAEHLIFAVVHVAGFVRACADRGNAPTFEALQAHYRLAGDAATAAGGWFVKAMGDGVLLAFPPARAADAVTALRRFHDQGGALWRAFDVRCHTQVRVGAGTVQCGELGPPGAARTDIVGHDLNVFLSAPWADFEVAPGVRDLIDSGTDR